MRSATIVDTSKNKKHLLRKTSSQTKTDSNAPVIEEKEKSKVKQSKVFDSVRNKSNNSRIDMSQSMQMSNLNNTGNFNSVTPQHKDKSFSSEPPTAADYTMTGKRTNKSSHYITSSNQTMDSSEATVNTMNT